MGQAARDGMFLRVECKACGHTGFHRSEFLLKVVEAERRLDAVPFACSSCHAKGANVEPLPFDYDRPPKIMVWTQMPLRR